MTSRPTRAEIDALLKLAEAATPRPWHMRAGGVHRMLKYAAPNYVDVACSAERRVIQTSQHLGEPDPDAIGGTCMTRGEAHQEWANGHYIAAACNAAPALVARVRELSAALASIGCIHPMAGRKAGTTCISLCFSRANYCGVCAALSEKP